MRQPTCILNVQNGPRHAIATTLCSAGRCLLGATCSPFCRHCCCYHSHRCRHRPSHCCGPTLPMQPLQPMRIATNKLCCCSVVAAAAAPAAQCMSSAGSCCCCRCCSVHELLEQRIHTCVPCGVVQLQQVAGLTQAAVNNDVQLLQEVPLVVPTAV